jgi:RimJ/RimL family protein N-acetyltransferase
MPDDSAAAETPIEIVSDSTIVLRQLADKDVTAAVELLAGLPSVGTPEDAKAAVTSPTSAGKTHFGIWNGFELIGALNLHRYESDKAEVQYWLGRDFSSAEFGGPAVTCAVKYAFEMQKLFELIAKINLEDDLGKMIFEQAGFMVRTISGTDWVYGLFRTEFAG